MRILLITSMPIHYSGDLVINKAKVLMAAGHQVDILTKTSWPSRGYKVLSVYRTPLIKIIRFYLGKYAKKADILGIRRIFKKLYKNNSDKNDRIVSYNLNGILISNPDESNPPVKICDILDKIDCKYDLVITSFLEHMLTIPSLLAIYKKLKCPIIIGAVDQAPFTGGCWFSVNCDRYKFECGKCPGLGSSDENDQTHKNYLIKKEAYSKMNYILLTNTWMMKYAKASKLFDPYRLIVSYIMIDEDKFRPYNRLKCKKKFGFNKEDIVFVSRYHTSKSKGIDVYINALNFLYKNCNESIRERVIVTFVGTSDESIKKRIQFRVNIIPELDIFNLIKLYNAASFFVSPSISDAGPSMVNQSIMCGTPVCSFNIGTAIDVIKDGENGYVSKEIAAEGLKKCLMRAVETSSDDYFLMRKKSREIALKYESKTAYIRSIKEAYQRAKTLTNE